jgi:hypothetical protein
MLSKRALLEKLVGKKIFIMHWHEQVTITDLPPGEKVYNVITQVGTDVFAFEIHSTVGEFPKKIRYLSIDMVKHICTS